MTKKDKTHKNVILFIRSMIDKYEGVYSCDDRDPGRATLFGISQRYHPDLKLWPILADFLNAECASPLEAEEVNEALAQHEPIRKALKEMAVDYYYRHFWRDGVAGHFFLPKVGYYLLDWAVNAGPDDAIRGLQLAINDVIKVYGLEEVSLTADGILGPKTRRAYLRHFNAPGSDPLDQVSPAHDQLLMLLLKTHRAIYYLGRIQERPALGVFLPGWLRRTFEMPESCYPVQFRFEREMAAVLGIDPPNDEEA